MHHRVLRGLIYPLILSALLVGRGHDGWRQTMMLALLLHFAYFCGISLFATVQTFSLERQRQTFDSLVVTKLSPREWLRTLLRISLWPKLGELLLWSPAWLWLLHRTQQEFANLCTASPAGSSLLQWLALVTATGACILAYSVAGVLISLRARSNSAALMNASLALVTSFFLLIPLDAILLGPLVGYRDPILSAMFCPWLAFALQMERLNSLGPGVGGLIFSHLALAWGGYRLALKWLSQPSSPKATSGTRRAIRASKIDNPIFYRYWLKAGRSLQFWIPLMVIPAGVVGLAWLAVLVPRIGARVTAYLAISSLLLWLTIQAVNNSIDSFANDQEGGTLETLSGSGYSLHSVFRSKVVLQLLMPLLLCGLCAPLWFLFSPQMGGQMTGRECFLTSLLNLSWAAFVNALAIWFSCRENTAQKAISRTIGWLVALCLATPLLDAAVNNDLRTLALACPVIAIFSLSDPAIAGGGLAVGALYSIAALALLWSASRSFGKQKG